MVRKSRITDSLLTSPIIRLNVLMQVSVLINIHIIVLRTALSSDHLYVNVVIALLVHVTGVLNTNHVDMTNISTMPLKHIKTTVNYW